MAEQPKPLRSRRAAIRRRRLVAVAVFAGVLVAVGSVAGLALSRRDAEPLPPPPPPPPRPFRIIYPEGFTREDMADRVSAIVEIARRTRNANVRLNRNAYLAASRGGVVPCFGRRTQRNLEGFLFPAAYDFFRDTPSRRLVLDQIEAFCDNWRKLDLRYARSKNLTSYDVLTIASMIEKEAQAPEERRLVSAVIYNRLRNRMTLGIDATLRYGLHIPPTKSILQSQLDTPTPYNTRMLQGLPPTPISNPGLAALQAAAHPAKVDYLFYARKPDHKHHFFTASQSAFDQFLAEHGYG